MQENGYFGLKMYATLSLHRILGYISVLGLSYSLVLDVLCYFQVKISKYITFIPAGYLCIYRGLSRLWEHLQKLR